MIILGMIAFAMLVVNLLSLNYNNMTPAKRFGFLVAPLALAAFAVFINVNSAHSDRIGHGWYYGFGTILAVLAAWQLILVIKESN